MNNKIKIKCNRYLLKKYDESYFKKVFPKTDYSKIQYDCEGLYSITNPIEAQKISNLIKSKLHNNDSLNIFDGTGGLGGNTINFAINFKSVTTCELNIKRYNMLVNNIDQYDLKNVIKLNTNSIDYLYNNYNNFDVFFFDPPWGGPTYKKYKNLSLKMNNKSLLEIAQYLKDKIINKLLIYKLPYNYNFNEFNQFNYKLYKINKYYIMIIKI